VPEVALAFGRPAGSAVVVVGSGVSSRGWPGELPSVATLSAATNASVAASAASRRPQRDRDLARVIPYRNGEPALTRRQRRPRRDR
jgi:hypothetical protein